MNRKILELNLYGEPIYIDLNLVCVIGQVVRYVSDSSRLYAHEGFIVRLNISAPFSTNNEYEIYFPCGKRGSTGYHYSYPENSPEVIKLYNKVVDIVNQMIDIWSGKTPGDNFVIHLSEKELTQ